MLYFTYLDVRELFDGARLREGLETLPPERASRVMDLQGYAPRARRLGGELLLHYLFEQSEERFADLSDTDTDDGFPEIAEGEFGKPYFAHRSDIEFNISHSGLVAVCALNRVPSHQTATQVGVDVEMVGTKTPEQMQALASRFFLRDERKLLNHAITSDEYIKAFTRIWVRKESIVKCLGRGLRDIIFADSTNPEKHGIKLDDREIWIPEQAISASGRRKLYYATVAEKLSDHEGGDAEEETKKPSREEELLDALADFEFDDLSGDAVEDTRSERQKNFFDFEL